MPYELIDGNDEITDESTVGKASGIVWEVYETTEAGRGWCWAIGVVRLSGYRRRVRVALGRKYSKGEEPPQYRCPIKTVARIDIRLRNWVAIRELIDRMFYELIKTEEGTGRPKPIVFEGGD